MAIGPPQEGLQIREVPGLLRKIVEWRLGKAKTGEGWSESRSTWLAFNKHSELAFNAARSSHRHFSDKS